MAGVRRKQDDKNLKILREIVTSGSGGNRQCFDCGQKGPTYVNMTIGSFVCTRCSGVLRGLTPPHRVKSISMATFTPDEIEFLKINGNEVCAKTWLGLWDPKRIIHQEQRELMIDKYERKRYFLEPASPLKSLTNSATKLPAMNGGSNLNGGSHHHLNNNNNSSAKHTSENNLKNITLTPPSSLRLSSNNNPANCNNSSSNRQQNRYNFQNQFTPEENGFFDSTTAVVANNRQNLQNSNNNLRNINNMNGSNSSNNSTSQLVNGLNGRQVNNKNSLNISTTNSDHSGGFTSNKFTPDSDFVADFGSAHIFNASDNGSNSTNQLNGFKIYQNGTAGGTNNNHGHGNHFVNGAPTANGSTTGLSNANANFADFDHAPIYNAAGLPISINSTSNSLSSSATFTSNSSINSTPPADRYAALKDLDEQLREIKTSVSDSFSAQAPATSSPNPFKQSPTAVQPPQQIGNPFQQPVNLFGSNQPSQSNAFGTSPSPILNYNNGYSGQAAMITNGSINNGCGMGYHGTAQQVSGVGNSITNMKNPFAVNSLNNSNNPFL